MTAYCYKLMQVSARIPLDVGGTIEHFRGVLLISGDLLSWRDHDRFPDVVSTPADGDQKLLTVLHVNSPRRMRDLINVINVKDVLYRTNGVFVNL